MREDGTEVSIHEETGYPFRDSIELKLSAPQAVQFPLYLRVPQWCAAASVKINGEAIDVKARPLSYIVLDRTWKDGDRVTLQLPMQIVVRRWPKNQDAASVSYGPLSFSLAIGERWEKYGDPKAKWPEWEVFPESAWNYGLVLDAQDPARSFEIVRQAGEVPLEPFTPAAAPLALKAKARKIPNWQTDRNEMVDRTCSPARFGPRSRWKRSGSFPGGGPLADRHVPRDRRRPRRPRLGCPGEAQGLGLEGQRVALLRRRHAGGPGQWPGARQVG